MKRKLFIDDATSQGRLAYEKPPLFLISQTKMQKRIIDKRRKEKFIMDDEYLNGQARLCGWQGTIVYNSLCRHANINQESFPSIKLMAEQHGVSRPTILKGIDNLEKRNVIAVKKMRNKSGKWLNNTYILLDKSEWNYAQVPVEDTASQVNVVDSVQVNVETQPSKRGDIGQVNVVDTKETHREGNTSKETHISELSSQVNTIMDIFYKINPTLDYKKPFNRQASEWMIKRFGLEPTINMALQIVSVLGKPYAPVATTPYQMKEKIAQFKIYFDNQKNNRKEVFKV